jgi:hypothetical protein
MSMQASCNTSASSWSRTCIWHACQPLLLIGRCTGFGRLSAAQRLVGYVKVQQGCGGGLSAAK